MNKFDPLKSFANGTAGKVIGYGDDNKPVDITHARFTSLFIQLHPSGNWVEAKLNDSEEWTFTPTTDPDA